MAENKDGQEKSEQASARRFEEAREKGQVAKSQDVTSAAVLLFGGLSVFIFGSSLLTNYKSFLGYMLHNAPTMDITYQNVIKYYPDLLLYMGKLGFPIVLLIFAVVIVAEISQVGLHFATKKFTDPEILFQHFKILSGLKRIFFSTQSLFELGKSLLKMIVILAVVYSVIGSRVGEIVGLIERPFQEIGIYMVSIAKELVTKVALTFIVIALGDFFYQKWKFNQDMMMTKQEVKEEHKQMEGNPQIKGRMRAIMRSRLRKMMMSAVPKADVVITNPTHFAVALKYDNLNMGAPKVVAKGADFLALQIRQVATLNDVTIVEDPPLARALYHNVEVDHEVPEDLFKAVAQVLAYVYKLKNKVLATG